MTTVGTTPYVDDTPDEEHVLRTTNASRRSKRLLTVGLLAALALSAGFLLSRSTSSQDPGIALIERYAEAWFGGDHGTALTILGFDPAESQLAIEWSRYEGAIGATTELECEPRGDSPAVYDCVISYSNSLYEAVEAPPTSQEWSGRVDGENIEVLGYEPNPGDIEDSWFEWALSALPPDTSPCDRLRPPTQECALFQLDHLDEWAIWHLSR